MNWWKAIGKSAKKSVRHLMCVAPQRLHKLYGSGSDNDSAAPMLDGEASTSSFVHTKSKSEGKQKAKERDKKCEISSPPLQRIRDTDGVQCSRSNNSIMPNNIEDENFRDLTPALKPVKGFTAHPSAAPEQDTTAMYCNYSALDLGISEPIQDGNLLKSRACFGSQQSFTSTKVCYGTAGPVIQREDTTSSFTTDSGISTIHESKSSTTIGILSPSKPSTTYYSTDYQTPSISLLAGPLRIVKAGKECWDSMDRSRYFEELVPMVTGACSLPLQEPLGHELIIHKSGNNVWFAKGRRRFQELEIPDFSPNNTLGRKRSTPAPAVAHVSPPEMHTKFGSVCSVTSEINGLKKDLSQKKSLKGISSQNNIQHPCDGLTKHTDDRESTNPSVCPGEDPTELNIDELSLTDLEGENIPAESESAKGSEKAQTLTLDTLNNGVRLAATEVVSTKNQHTGRGNKCYEVEEVIDKLERDDQGLNSEQPDDYSSLIEEIARITGGDSNIREFCHCPAPDDVHRLFVAAPGLKKMETKIKLLEKGFPKYTITVGEPVKVPPDGLPMYTNYLCDDPKMPYYLHANRERVANVGVFLKDKNTQQSKRVWAVTAGHSIMLDEEQIQIRCVRTHIEQKEDTRAVAERVIGRNNLNKRLTIAPHGHPEIKVRDSPLIAFHDHIPDVESGEDQLNLFQHFMSDIAVLPVDPDEVDKNILLNTPVHSPLAQYSSLPSPDKLNSPAKKTRIAGYLNIRKPEHIIALLKKGVRIICGDRSGRITQQPNSKASTPACISKAGSTQRGAMPPRLRQKWKMAIHIAFTTKDPLYGGYSGSPVMVYNQSDDELYIIGLLMGSFKGDSNWTETIYQATPLASSLRLLESLYPDHLDHLELVCGMERETSFSVHEKLSTLACTKPENDDGDNCDTGFNGSFDTKNITDSA